MSVFEKESIRLNILERGGVLNLQELYYFQSGHMDIGIV